MLLGPVPTCENCGDPILRADTGRVRRFCSGYCRVVAGRKAAGGFRNKSPTRGTGLTSCYETADLGYPRRLTWQAVAGPFCELFARERREGWAVWGDETDKFEPADLRHQLEDWRQIPVGNTRG